MIRADEHINLTNEFGGLILLNRGDNVYSNQCGGVACYHYFVKGILVTHPVPLLLQGSVFGLLKLIENDYNRIDKVFDKLGYAWKINKKSEFIQHACEAWLPIWIPNTDIEAIMIWENSD